MKKYPLIFLSAFLLLNTASSAPKESRYCSLVSSDNIYYADSPSVNNITSEIKCVCENELYRM